MKNAHQKRAILYFRVSTDEQADGYSLSHQEERLQAYCRMHGISVVASFREDHSAKTFDRPEFQKLLQFLRKGKGKADLLLFTKWDRFSRNAGDAYGMINQLKKLQVEPQAIEQPLDLSIPENKMMLAFYLAAPEVENDRRALNTLVGMRRAKKEGRWLGPAPKGYKNSRDEQNKPLLVPDEKTAPIVVWAFEQVATGTSDLDSVRRQVNERGLKVSKSRFWTLIRNMVYCGRVEVSAYQNESAHYVKGIHRPLISGDLFDRVQDILFGRRRITKVRSTKDENLPLRGALVCRSCGRPLTGSAAKGNGGKYYYYHCQTASACKERFRADLAHQALEVQLRSIEVKKSIQQIYLRQMELLFQKSGNDKQRKTKEIQADIDKQKQRLRNAQGLMLDGALSTDEYRELGSGIKIEIEALEEAMNKVVTAMDDFQLYQSSGRSLLQNPSHYWSKAPLSNKQQIVSALFPGKMQYEGTSITTLASERPLLSSAA